MSVMSKQEVVAAINNLASSIKLLAEALVDGEGNTIVQALQDLNAGHCLRVAPALEHVAAEIASASHDRSIDCGAF